MIKVITYGTYDFLHFGHIRLLQRAKSLGDYLIVGVTADDFDIARGKINVQHSLLERVEAVRATGLADEIIVEEYEGQKIDDIQKHGVDIFTVGSDWIGKFDYLKDYCKVIYLDRTEGVSSTDLRNKDLELKIGIVGDSGILKKFVAECRYVNGAIPLGFYTLNPELSFDDEDISKFNSFEKIADESDALYIASHPSLHFKQIKYALEKGKHVIYESPLTTDASQAIQLFELADKNNCVLYEGIKTAYSTAYSRMILMAKTGKIGNIVSVDATCTSLANIDLSDKSSFNRTWNSVCSWGPTALLPIFQILGIDYSSIKSWSKTLSSNNDFDIFTRITFEYPDAVASLKVAKGVKSEGELVISGTKGYILVPSPWWKTDYFEIRYEDQNNNKRFFYQLEGEGIRNMIASFVKSINHYKISYIHKNLSIAIAKVIALSKNK